MNPAGDQRRCSPPLETPLILCPQQAAGNIRFKSFQLFNPFKILLRTVSPILNVLNDWNGWNGISLNHSRRFARGPKGSG